MSWAPVLAELGDKVPVVEDEQEQPKMEQTHTSPSPSPNPAVARLTMEEVFNLDEGPVTLKFPATLSEESYQDLEDLLEIVLRMLKRRVVKPAQPVAGYKIDLDEK